MISPASRLTIRVLIRLKVRPHPGVNPITREAAVDLIGVQTVIIIPDFGRPIRVDPVFQVDAADVIIIYFTIDDTAAAVDRGTLELPEHISRHSGSNPVVDGGKKR